ncbi:MAG: nitrate reductase molybdenum cofactor assembly chaperone [Tabrizicola sp.]|uniref:nitrate reductase molybdenum cofactor assembly chaperone n=1 Tax=Tabrizicola sp. TaxID=2005166 RepID=UPI0027373AE7|nr:nitrate reductase molybdenum cofactor assembly chaperone [Tabrizicola sp.]MDP3264191.1 nitrate reductase molybdenum cofactor assembly chaperone [Tabrizicola sp.]MDZ4066081.1 nitrate reductase molybdenum cofactor assembly chaperone [Tabrizicola sp.]
MKSLKALSALLSYPTADLQSAIPEIGAILHAEGLFAPRKQVKLEPLLHWLAEDDLYEVQETYVLLFDRARTLSLNLFEHVHGESRDRGGAMVDLLETYRAGGFDLTGTELPDHLPVLLEFLSTRSRQEAQDILADAGPILVALADRLARRESPYAAVLAALVDFAGADRTTQEAKTLLAEAMDDPTDLAALDQTYAEAQVMFGPDPDAGCPAARDMLSRMAPSSAPAAPRAPALN